jgi:hypothetical protein
MAKLDQKFKKRPAYKFDDGEVDILEWEHKKHKKIRRETRQRNPEYGIEA